MDNHPASERLGVSCARKIHTRAILKEDSLASEQGHQTGSGKGPSAILAWVDAAETGGTLSSVLAPRNWGGGEGTPRKPRVNIFCQPRRDAGLK